MSAWPAALADERRYLETLASDVRALVERGEPITAAADTAAASERARWDCSTTTMPATQLQHIRKLNGNSRAQWRILTPLLRSERGATMTGHRFRLLCIAGAARRHARRARCAAATAEPYDPWPGLVQDIFNDRPMNDGTGVIAIEMPTAPRMRRSFR